MKNKPGKPKKSERQRIDEIKSVIGTRMALGGPPAKPKIPDYKFRGQGQRVPSLVTTKGGACGSPEPQTYTGTAVLGIATLHKSNAVPVFSEKDAVDISKMRRG